MMSMSLSPSAPTPMESMGNPMALMGMVKHMPDAAQIQMYQNPSNPGVQFAVMQELQQRRQMRQQQQAQMAQQQQQAQAAQQGQAQQTQQALSQMGQQATQQTLGRQQADKLAGGIGQLPAPNMAQMAGGGLVAFAEGGEAEEKHYAGYTDGSFVAGAYPNDGPLPGSSAWQGIEAGPPYPVPTAPPAQSAPPQLAGATTRFGYSGINHGPGLPSFLSSLTGARGSMHNGVPATPTSTPVPGARGSRVDPNAVAAAALPTSGLATGDFTRADRTGAPDDTGSGGQQGTPQQGGIYGFDANFLRQFVPGPGANPADPTYQKTLQDAEQMRKERLGNSLMAAAGSIGSTPWGIQNLLPAFGAFGKAQQDQLQGAANTTAKTAEQQTQAFGHQAQYQGTTQSGLLQAAAHIWYSSNLRAAGMDANAAENAAKLNAAVFKSYTDAEEKQLGPLLTQLQMEKDTNKRNELQSRVDAIRENTITQIGRAVDALTHDTLRAKPTFLPGAQSTAGIQSLSQYGPAAGTPVYKIGPQ